MAEKGKHLSDQTDLETDADIVNSDDEEVARALRTATEALAREGLSDTPPYVNKEKFPSSKFSRKGKPTATIVTNSHNVHIGNKSVSNHYYYTDGTSRPTSSSSRKRDSDPQKVPDEVKRLVGEDRKLTTKEKSNLADNIGRKWRQVGRSLNITDGELDNIDCDYNRDGLHETIYQMIIKWERKSGKRATVGSFVQELIQLNLISVIETVFLNK